MGEAKRRKQAKARGVGMSKRDRFVHLLRLVSPRMVRNLINRYADIRKL